MDREDRLAVVVITWNRAAEAVRAVEALRRLPERPAVIVVDNGSSDGTAERLEALADDGVRLIRAPRNLGGAGRTLGVEATDAPYVAFCDDDMAWEPGSLRRAADILDAHPGLGVVAARVVVGADGREDPVCRAMAASPLPQGTLPGPAVLGFLAGASMVRREAYLAVGGFEPRFMVGGEEELFAARVAAAGWDIAYVPEVVARHFPSPVRHPERRRRIQARNALWSAWLCYPPDLVVRRTAAVLRDAAGDAAARRGVFDAVRGLGWVLRDRRPLPAPVASAVRLKEATTG